jgi:hypothetical protein
MSSTAGSRRCASCATRTSSRISELSRRGRLPCQSCKQPDTNHDRKEITSRARTRPNPFARPPSTRRAGASIPPVRAWSSTSRAGDRQGPLLRYHGTLDLSTQPAIELTIEADSLDTQNEKRDAHLRSPDFFDAEKHPYVRFVSESTTLDGEWLQVRGRLHARDRSIPLELHAALRRIGDDLEIAGATEADHRQLDMTWNRMSMIRTPTKLMATGRLVRDAA